VFSEDSQLKFVYSCFTKVKQIGFSYIFDAIASWAIDWSTQARNQVLGFGDKYVFRGARFLLLCLNKFFWEQHN